MNLKLSFFNCKAMEIEFYKKILIFAFLLLFFHSAYKTFRAQTLPTRWSGHVLCLQDGVGTALPTRPSGHKACLQDGVGKPRALKALWAQTLPTRRCGQGLCPQDGVGKALPTRRCRQISCPHRLVGKVLVGIIIYMLQSISTSSQYIY